MLLFSPKGNIRSSPSTVIFAVFIFLFFLFYKWGVNSFSTQISGALGSCQYLVPTSISCLSSFFLLVFDVKPKSTKTLTRNQYRKWQGHNTKSREQRFKSHHLSRPFSAGPRICYNLFNTYVRLQKNDSSLIATFSHMRCSETLLVIQDKTCNNNILR